MLGLPRPSGDPIYYNNRGTQIEHSPSLFINCDISVTSNIHDKGRAVFYVNTSTPRHLFLDLSWSVTVAIRIEV